MKSIKKILAVFLTAALLLGTVSICASAYAVSDDLQKKLDKIYNSYNFTVGWGVYDISGGSAKLVAGKNADKSFQSNCTIKSAMMFCICRMMDAGELSLSTKLPVDKNSLHYTDFPELSGKYSVRSLLNKMVKVSNNAAYEVLLRYVTKEKFNAFLSSIGSGTQVASYNYMGSCTPNNRAIEWYALYKYCHSGAEHASFAWNLVRHSFNSPIRTALVRPVAHKAGWYTADGTAADCAVVKSRDGGCYLMVIFTKNNGSGAYELGLIRKLAKVLDDVWSEYYNSLPADSRTRASF